jgi:hypothetical protein
MRFEILIYVGLGCLTGGAAVAADQPAFKMGDLVQANDNMEIRAMLGGVAAGLEGANVELSLRKQPLLYCRPDGEVLDGARLNVILQQFMAKKPYSSALDATMIGIVSTSAARDAYPCID